MNTSLRWLVVGAGAIGTYLGASLQLHGQQVTFLEQAAAAAEIRQRGLRLQLERNKSYNIAHPCLAVSMEEALQGTTFDAVILAIKSFDTTSFLEKAMPHQQYLPVLICFQNGVENEARLASSLGADRVIPGTVTSAVARRAVGDIIAERQRGLGMSSLHPHSIRFAQVFNQAGLNTRLYHRPADMKWSKMLTNLVGNATSAILDLTPAQVFADPKLFKLEIRQLREALAVMQSFEIRAVNLPGVPVRLLALAARHFPYSIAQPLMQRTVGRGRGAKMPSFHIDLHSGRGQSEVDYLNGAVVRAGTHNGVPTPVNALLNETLLGLISGAIPLAKFHHNPPALLDRLTT